MLLTSALAAAGCGKGATEPNTPPPGAVDAAAKRRVAIAGSATAAPVAPLHPAWPGTRTWTEREVAVDTLRRTGTKALPALVEMLHGQDAELRELAARGIALMGPPAHAAVPDLIAALSDLDPDVRKNVMRAIGQMGPSAQAAIPALVQEVYRGRGEHAESRPLQRGTISPASPAESVPSPQR